MTCSRLMNRHRPLLVLQGEGRRLLSKRSGITARTGREIHSSVDRMSAMSRRSFGRCSLYQVSLDGGEQQPITPIAHILSAVIVPSSTCVAKCKKICLIKPESSRDSTFLLSTGKPAHTFILLYRCRLVFSRVRLTSRASFQTSVTSQVNAIYFCSLLRYT